MPARPTAKMRAAKVRKAVTPQTAIPQQIAVTSNAYGGSGRVVEAVTVLMSDGTIWRFPMVGADPENQVWVQLPPVGTTPATASPKE